MKRLLSPLLLVALCACQQQTNEPQKLTDAQIEQRIDELLPQLTLEEKVAMCHAQSKFSSAGVPRLGIPELWMSDGPHGVRAEINWDDWGYSGWTSDSCTAFPALTALASTFNPELSYQYGVTVGEEARYRKKDVLLGPGVNIYRTPLCGRNFEYMGEDPYLASVMAVPYIKGVQSNGVAACVKHYALNNQEQWRGEVDVEVSDRALYEIYLPAFEAAVKEGGAWSIMGAYNQYRGQHCCHNERLLNTILKQDWQFDGCVITDWGGCHDTKQAALYGLDIEMGTYTNGLTSSTAFAYSNYYLANDFFAAVKSGEISEDVLNDKVRRILRLMLRTTLDTTRPFGALVNEAHSQAALNVAREAIVLLKNSGNTLPLDANAKLTIAVIGENATRPMTPGGGSSELKAKYEVSPLEGIRSRFPNATIINSLGYASGPSAYGRVIPSPLDADSLVNAAVDAARNADVVVYVGGLNKNHEQDCEAGDRTSLNLPFGQDELIAKLLEVNKNVIVTLISGNAVAMPWIDDVPAIMQAWYLGSEAGNAIADVLSGRTNPSGKLPFSFPVKLEDNAAHSFGEISMPGIDLKQEYKEGILVGYRWFDTKGIKPLFAFGHGLSYTTFELRDAKLSATKLSENATLKATVTVANAGAVDGAEVVQLYVGKQDSEVERAKKELKGFAKVSVAKGATQTVSIEVPVSKLAYYDEQSAAWKVEKGLYTVSLGTASDNIAYSFDIEVQ